MDSKTTHPCVESKNLARRKDAFCGRASPKIVEEMKHDGCEVWAVLAKK